MGSSNPGIALQTPANSKATAAVPTTAAAPLRAPELLAPAGDWECAKAAVENGADAIYFGLERFNARMRAHNFTEADLPKLMAFLHGRGVKGYVTFNTLVFANELPDAENYLRSIIAAGVDAAIVQDIGICKLIRKLSPDFPIHASTQMTISSAAGVEFARELGCELVVLARECSIKEIEKIQQAQTQAGHAKALPLEVFVHGALCVAYSGQCLTSESLGGRSANRGECAQACRMPYELVSDGEIVPLGDRRYLLSPQDLSGMEVLPDLVRLGMTSLKIEGRLKTPEYVANITKAYRRAIDTAVKQGDFETVKQETRYDLEMGFSRGLYTGWFRGNNNQELAHARFGKKRGVLLGEVGRIYGERIGLKLIAPLRPGDGVVFDAGHPDQKEEGGFVYTIEKRGDESLLGFGHDDLDYTRIKPGDKLWKTSDPVLDKQLRKTYAGETPQYQRPIHFEVHGQVGSPMTLVVRDEQGNIARAESSMALVLAEKVPLSTERLRDQLGRLGGTAFELGELQNHLTGALMLPVSELNKMRRDVVTQLDALRATPKRWQLNEVKDASRIELPVSETAAATEPELIVLVRNLAQLDTALECGVQTLYCEFEDTKKYREAVTTTHTSGGCTMPRRTIWVTPPRIFKMGEEWMLNQVRSCNADGYLVRNYDHLKFFANDRRIGDFSLNVANPLTAEHFMKRFRLERLTISYDLNVAQLEALLKSAPPEWFEITLHQHMPMFHMEHCVFCAFLSKGRDYTDCGRPCDKHDVRLRDRVGALHPLKADTGCRNTVFNSQAQSGAEFAAKMITLGARNFRIEFLNETQAEVKDTIAKYRQLLRGEITGTQLWRELKLQNQLGVTRGQMAG